MFCERMTQFLDRGNSDFLRGALWEADIEPLPSLRGRRDEWLTPDMISEREVADWAGQIIHESRERSFGDLPQTVSASFNVPWLELLCGCAARVHGDTIWAETAGVGYESLSQLVLDPDNPWFRKWLECQEALRRVAQDRFPVSLPVMHGPLDLLSAVRGPEQLCLDLADRPEDVRRALDRVTQVWITAARALVAVTPLWKGGMCSRMKLWLPGPSVTVQDDASALLSPPFYNEFVREFEEEIVRSFPCHTYHSHSTSAHLLDLIAALPTLTSIQLTLDPNGPPRPKLRETIIEVLRRRPVLLCVWDRDWAEWCEQSFRPEGVCIAYVIRSSEDWKVYEDWTGKNGL